MCACDATLRLRGAKKAVDGSWYLTEEHPRMGTLYHYATVINSWSHEEDLSYQQEKGKDMNALDDGDDPELAAMAQMIMEQAFFEEPMAASADDPVAEQNRATEVILFVSVFFCFWCYSGPRNCG